VRSIAPQAMEARVRKEDTVQALAALPKRTAYRDLSAGVGMPANRCIDGLKTPLGQRRKVSFQSAIVFDQGVAKFGDYHPASAPASLAGYRDGLAE